MGVGRIESAGNSGPAFDEALDCQACGACCCYSSEWPRFSLEDDAALERIRRRFVDDERGRMRCNGDSPIRAQMGGITRYAGMGRYAA
jgi:hypothetical protein